MNSLQPDIGRAKYEAFLLTKEFAITQPEEIQLSDIAMALGIYIREETLVGAEARLVRNGPKGVIRINSAIQLIGRKRFTIAHELGHWRLHDVVFQVCTEEDLNGSGSKIIEVEANAFAGAFLMPTLIFSPYCSGIPPDLGLVCELADIFKTTMTATALRFIEESSYPCAVVMSENRKILWWKSRKDSGFWLEKGWEISPKSNAWDPLQGQRRRRVHPSLWFSETERFSNVDLYEQSMSLGRYGNTLTLLSIEDKLESEDDE